MKQAGFEHPKTVALQEVLQLNDLEVIGLLEWFFLFVKRYAPQGDVGRWSDERIARGTHWTSDPAILISAFIKTRWVEVSHKHRLVVHDWHEHCDESVRKALQRRQLGFVTLSRHRRDTVRKLSGRCPDPVESLSSLPSLALPSLALPFREEKEGASNGNGKRTRRLPETAWPWPDGFVPPPEFQDFARKGQLDPLLEWGKFHDRCRRDDARYRNWASAWRMHCRNAYEWKQQRR